jgi:type II secretory pathway pseudopilin PulG
MRHTSQKGMGLVEIVIGSAIIVTGIIALSSTYTAFVKYAYANQNNVQAAYLAEEAFEVVTYLRDSGWDANIKNLSTTTTYSLLWSSSNWATTTTPQYVDGTFLRQFTITDVKRDGADRISTTTGTYDPYTKKVTITIAYFQGHATTTRSLSTYITDLYGN